MGRCALRRARGKRERTLLLPDMDKVALEPGEPAASSRSLREIRETRGGGVRIGALVGYGDCAEHPFIRRRFPLIRQALMAPASAHVHPTDMIVALLALDALVEVQGVGGACLMSLAQFRESPFGAITAIELAANAFAGRSHFHRVRGVHGHAGGVGSVAVALDVSNGVIRGARVALGGVAQPAWRAAESERLLVGSRVGAAALEAAAAAVVHARALCGDAREAELARRAVAHALRHAAGISLRPAGESSAAVHLR
jgi:CO/xanthine dehydrogenase FAD-binding subunit